MIKVEQVSRSFGPKLAVKDLSFEVSPGEILGFLGPNGAGKSTTMKMISGFLAPSYGTITLCGYDVNKRPLQAKSLLGYLPEGAPLYGDMRVKSFLNFVADVRRLSGKYRRQQLKSVIEKMALLEVLNQPINTLSKGFVRRVGLAQAILHKPPVLILDEPTDGLDPNQKHQVRSMIRELANNTLVILSTHILEEVSSVCSRAIIINRGKKIIDETPRTLATRSRYYRAISLYFATQEDQQRAIANLIADSRTPKWEQDQNDHIRLFSQDGNSILPLVTEWMRQHNWPVVDLQIEQGRLDDVFRTLTQETQECSIKLTVDSKCYSQEVA